MAAAVTALLAISACGTTGAVGGGSGSSPASGGGAGASATDSSTAGSAAEARLATMAQPVTAAESFGKPVDASAVRGKTIFYIPFSANITYFSQVEENVKAAVTAAGANFYACDGQANPSGFNSCLDQALEQRPAVVIGDYVSYNLAPDAYNKLRAAQIPVLIYGSEPEKGVPTSANFAFGPPDYYEFPAVEGEDDAVIADSNGKAHVLYLRMTDNDAVTKIGLHAVSYLQQNCPGCTVTVKTVNAAHISNVPSLVASALTADPTINYVIAQADTYLTPAISGVQQAGKTTSIKYATINADLGDLQQLKSNPRILAFVGNNPSYLAWTEADSAIRMAAGQAAPASYPILNRAFTQDNIGSLTLTNSAANDGQWYGSRSYQQEFEKLWDAQ
jgi:ribose transport system substrate-binding protein